MRSGITRQALRRHRWSLLGPAVTQCAAATIIAMMVMTATALKGAPLSPAERAATQATGVPVATLGFSVIAVYLSVILVGVTMNLTIARQVRDIALLRAIGATPGRIRRSVALQAAIVAVPSAALGYLVGIAAGYAWTAALQAHGVLPQAVTFRAEPLVLPMVIGIEIVTSVAGALVAAIRPARIRPAVALTEAATRRPPDGRPSACCASSSAWRWWSAAWCGRRWSRRRHRIRPSGTRSWPCSRCASASGSLARCCCARWS
jgi:putative ABC transport system permease protein